MTQKPIIPIKNDTIFSIDVAEKLYADILNIFSDGPHLTVGDNLKGRIKETGNILIDISIIQLKAFEDKCSYSEAFKSFLDDKILFWTEVKMHLDRI